MNPAYSIIFFTTASGAGYGLLAVLGLQAFAGTLPGSRGFGIASLGLGVVLVTAGLLASTYHLGHPERAWRALSQWRSSWLSREGVAALATYVPVAVLAFLWVVLGRTDGLVRWAGLLSTAGCVATVICTGMIYASLRAVPSWRSAWVPGGYLALAAMTGTLWLAAVAKLAGAEPGTLAWWAPALVVVALVVKLAYWGRRRSPVAGRASATGLGRVAGSGARIEILDPPHTETNFLQREMGYVIARRHARRLREHATLLAFALPLLLSVLALALPGAGATAAFVLAALSASVGVVVERWLFFAEAEHTVSLYYHRSAV